MRASKEVVMKKTYATPTVAECGDVIIETRGAVVPGKDIGNGQLGTPEGSVGYNL